MPETKRLVWDQIGEHTYETGTDHGVLHLQDKEHHDQYLFHTYVHQPGPILTFLFRAFLFPPLIK